MDLQENNAFFFSRTDIIVDSLLRYQKDEADP